jgi:hypothetical protein
MLGAGREAPASAEPGPVRPGPDGTAHPVFRRRFGMEEQCGEPVRLDAVP